MGRRKIEIQPLTDDRNRTVTFVKRKAGLFKKAHELAVLCQVDLAVIIVGSNNKLYEFSTADTNEVIKVYQNTTRPHESKSPANYGNYKKKKHLTSNTGIIYDDDEAAVADEDDDEENESDSDTPEPKRKKRSFENMNNPRNNRPLPPNHISLSSVPAFSSFRNNGVKEEPEDDDKLGKHYRNDSINSSGLSRPILRVQIPTDAKGSNNDSARTLTALDTSHNPSNMNTTSKLQDIHDSSPPESSKSTTHNNGPSLNTPKFAGFSAFRSPDVRKPINLPIPIQSKSQNSSPSSATAPPLPGSSVTSFFNTLPQPSPSSQYPNGALLGQVYGGDPKLRSFHNANPSETPVTGLPSRYVNDMFPSPSTFYVPQEWSNSSMTPYHNLPQYFMNMLPNNKAPQAQSQGSSNPTHTSNTNPTLLSSVPSHGPGSQNNPNAPGPLGPVGGLGPLGAQNIQHLQNLSYQLPSPLQFIGQPFQQNDDKK